MRIGIDGTSAATQFAGVGRYTRELLHAHIESPGNDRFEILCTCSPSEAGDLERSLPPGNWRTIRRLPVSDRIATVVWQRLRAPIPVDLALGEIDVFHGPDFVLPPVRNAAAVVTIHDCSFLVAPEYGEPSLVAYLRQAVPRAISRAGAVITVSASVAAELAECFPESREKIHAIPNGFRPVNQGVVTTDRSNRPTVLIVGTIEPRKNHLTLLDAMEHVRREHPDALLIIAGRIGWQSDAIVERIRQAVDLGHTQLIEGPDDETLHNLYRRAHVFAFPSHYEGFGLPVLEAMSHGVPVVASDIPSLRETAGDAARFVPATCPDALAGQVLNLLDNQEQCGTLIAAGHQRVQEHSWTETARRTRRAYEHALERRRDG